MTSSDRDGPAGVRSDHLDAGFFGEYPVFCCRMRNGDRVRAAARITDLRIGRSEQELGVDALRVDPLGLATLLTLGFPLGARTVFTGVERLGPAGVVDSVHEVMLRTAALPQPMSAAPSTAQIVELAMEALRRTAPHARPVIPLSGGRDSRMILLGLRRLGIRPRLLLTADSPTYSVDARLARELASQSGDPLEFLGRLPWNIDREYWRHTQSSFESLEHGWFLAVALRARALGGAVTDGIGAGVLSTGSLMKAEAVDLWKSARVDELADWTVAHAAGTTASFRVAVRSAGFPLATDDEVKQELVRTLRELSIYPNSLGTFSLLHWTRRGIGASAFGLLGRENVVAPWMDAALCRALLAIELDEALRRDWRDDVLSALDRSGIPIADDVMPSGRRPIGSVSGALAWKRFRAACPPSLRSLFDACERSEGSRRSFARSAFVIISMLRALIDG